MGRSAIAAFAFLCAACAVNTNEATPRLDRSGLTLTFDDDFNRLAWEDPRTVQPGGPWKTWYHHDRDPYNLHNRTLPGNQEMQVYGDPAYFSRIASGEALGFTPVSTGNGKLLLRAEPAPASLRSRIWDRQYISGMVANWGSFAQTYGVFDLRAKLPAGKGLWPAFWLLPADGGYPPEIDVMEVLGDKPGELNVGYIANNRGGKLNGNHEAIPTADLSEDFHTYSVEWRSDFLIYYLDDVEVRRWPTPPEMRKPMYLIINLAVGGKWPGAPDQTTKFPATMEVDWVRAYERTPARRANSR